MNADLPRTQSYPGWIRYGAALVAVASALVFRGLLDHALHGGLALLTMHAAVAFAVWFGGWRPGVFAALVGFIGANYFFMLPRHTLSLSTEIAAAFAGYALSCGMIIALGAMVHRAQRQTALEMAERKAANDAQAREKELLATTLISIGDAVIAADPKGDITFINPEAERLTGWTDSLAAGRPVPEVFRIINEHTRAPVENPVEQVFRTRKVVALANHTLLISRNGQETPIDDSAAPIRDPDGAVSGVVLVFRDATEHRKAQEAIASLAAVVEYSGDAIFTKNLDGYIQTWNASAERLFGYRAEEIVGKHITVLFPPDRLKEEDYIISRLRQGQPFERLETVRVAKNGRHIPVSLSVSPLKAADGQIIGASKIVHDITERKQIEKALGEAHEQLNLRAQQLESLVQQRTAKLQETVGELESFSYSITHDMRAPLRAMQSFGNLLMQEVGDISPAANDYVRRITTAAERMDRLIQDVLNYSRVVRADLTLVPVDVRALLEGIIETYPSFQMPSAEVILEGDFVPVRANEAAMTQCISNLLGNAIKFVAKGVTPCVRVRSEVSDGRVRVLFRDNGIGIRKEAHDKIFQMFHRLSNHYEGTGIGLTIVKKAIERMGGQVGFESQPGQGSTFWLELAAAPAKSS